MAATNIEWADRVWNPVTGCTKVSQGCKHCYAEVMAKRTFGRLYPPVYIGPGCDEPADEWRARSFTDVQTHADRLDAPLRWRKPARIFVNSMSDLFHEDVPDAFIDKVFAVMALAPQHTFLVLTKRPERMRAYMEAFSAARVGPVLRQIAYDADGRPEGGLLQRADIIDEGWCQLGGWWPLPNVWLGVSVEDQATADQRIPLLFQTPAAVRWISAEPLLGPIDLNAIHTQSHDGLEHGWWSAVSGKRFSPWADGDVEAPRLDWVVVGGESGPKARPCHIDWIRRVVEQCLDAGVPPFVKQLGAKSLDWSKAEPTGKFRTDPETGQRQIEVRHPRQRDRKGGNPDEWSADLRVREFPAVRS